MSPLPDYLVSFDQLVLLGRKLTRLGAGQAAMLELNCMSRESSALVHEYKYRRCCTGACEKPSKETNQLFGPISPSWSKTNPAWCGSGCNARIKLHEQGKLYRRCCTGACEKPSKETNQLFFCYILYTCPCFARLNEGFLC